MYLISFYCLITKRTQFGIADSNSEFVASQGKITFVAAEKSGTVSIGILAPVVRHTGNHQFALDIFNSSNQMQVISTTVVTIVNDYAVIFFNRSYIVQVPENLSPGALLVPQIRWNQSISNVSFSILGGSATFVINQSTAVILTKQVLNWIATPTYTIVVKASLPDGSFDFATVQVTVLDVNDNSPTFTQSVNFGTFNESVPNGTLVLQVLATDPDFGPNGTVVYSLVTPSTDFAIASSTGIITTIRNFNSRVDPSTYSLSIRASDQGPVPRNNIASVSIFLQDLNLYSPVFGQSFYNISISETTAIGTLLFTLTATDADRVGSRNSFVFFSGLSNSTIVSVSSSGAVTLVSPLDYMAQRTYNISVLAIDGGSPPRSTPSNIIINLNYAVLPPPQFSSNVYSGSFTSVIPKNATVCVLSVQFPLSQPNVPPRFSLKDNSVADLISVDAMTGVITTKTVCLQYSFHSL